MNKEKNGYIDGKYYADGKEVELSKELKEIFESFRKKEESMKRQERRYGVYPFSAYEKYLIDSISEGISPEDMLLAGEKLSSIKEILLKLTDEELSLINLLIKSEKTEREIASILGVNRFTVNKRKNKIFDKLRSLLGEILSCFF